MTEPHFELVPTFIELGARCPVCGKHMALVLAEMPPGSSVGLVDEFVGGEICVTDGCSGTGNVLS